GVIDVHGGREHVIALDESGAVYTWGSNQHGQIGQGTLGGLVSSPQPVAGLSNVVTVTTGHYHSLALLADGSLRSWGMNAAGQLGDGTQVRRTSPVSVTGGNSFIGIAAGRNMSYAIREDGTLWAWGLNSEGQLGNG